MNQVEQKPYVPERVKEINAQIAASPLASQGISVAPISNTISSDTLSSNIKPLTLPTNTQNTVQSTGASVQGITEGLNTGIQGIITAEQAKAQEAQKATNTTKGFIEKQLEKLAGKGQAQIDAEKNAGISEKTQALTDITNEYNTKQLEYRRMEEAVQKEGTLTDVQKQQRLREISRVKNTELADIGIKQAVAQNNLSTAQALVDRKIDLEYGDLKDLINYQTDFLKMNREDLSKAEQNQLNLKLTEDTRKYEEGKSIGEFAKQVAANGADASTISRVSSAKTMAEAIQAAGQYAGDMLERQIKQAQLNKLNTEISKVISESLATQPTIKQQTEATSTINDINNLLSNEAFDSTFGITNIIGRNVPGSSAYGLNAQINNLTNKLALAARGQLKGQGAVSDFEGKMLKEAQTALSINMSPEQARRELTKIRGALATSSGLNTLVKITNPKTGESKNVEVSQEGISQAIKDGLQVEYQ